MDKLIIDNLEEFYVTALDVNNVRKTDLNAAEEIYFQIRDRHGIIILSKLATLGQILINVPEVGDLKIKILPADKAVLTPGERAFAVQVRYSADDIRTLKNIVDENGRRLDYLLFVTDPIVE
jgi:hypothetical protein